MRNCVLAAVIMLDGAAAMMAQTIELRAEPASTIYLNDSARRLGITDLMVQTVAVGNLGADSVAFTDLRIEVWKGGAVIAADQLLAENYARVWTALHPYFADPATQNADDTIILFSRVLPDGVTLSPSLTLAPGSAILIRNRLLTLSGYVLPDSLTITARATATSGAVHTARTGRRVARHRSDDTYILPVRGRWYIAAASSPRSHHRLRLAHEFALDLTRIGEDGRSFATDGSRPDDYYAFGKDVLAVADGRVVAVENAVPETAMPHPGESRADFARRVLGPLWDADPTGRLAGGNYVVIEHAGGAHSVYVHLRHGSVAVAPGDTVRQGQVIGQVGISGDGFEPHLHFQIVDGPDMNYSQGLPVTFSNVRPVGFSSTIDSRPDRPYLAGEFIETIGGAPQPN